MDIRGVSEPESNEDVVPGAGYYSYVKSYTYRSYLNLTNNLTNKNQNFQVNPGYLHCQLICLKFKCTKVVSA